MLRPECDSTLGATAIRVLCLVAPNQAATPTQHQVRIIVIVTTSFHDEELSAQCMMGMLVINIIGLTEVALIRTVERAMSLNANKRPMLTSSSTGVQCAKLVSS